MEVRYPGISDQIEASDVVTPMTTVRYTGNWKGAWEGWVPSTSYKTMGMIIKNTLPGLKNFYMIGQWTTPGGGLPPAAKSGRDAIQYICRKDRKDFNTSMA